MSTDKVYIEKIIRNYERRKTIAVIFGVVAIVLAGASYFAYVELSKGATSIIGFSTTLLAEGIKLTKADILLVEKGNSLAYYYGYKMGGAINTLSICAGFALGFCLKSLFWSKKERIIKELYEKTQI